MKQEVVHRIKAKPSQNHTHTLIDIHTYKNIWQIPPDNIWYCLLYYYYYYLPLGSAGITAGIIYRASGKASSLCQITPKEIKSN